MTAGLAACGAFLLRGQLETWAQHTPAGPALAALFRSVPMPGGQVAIMRPPADARPALTKLITGAPGDAALYRLRAQEDEMALDFAAAELDWKEYAAHAADGYAAQIELADFYHRRVRPAEEVAALEAAATAPDDPLLPASAQRAWHAFERATSLPECPAGCDALFRAWVARFPKEAAAWRKLIEHLTAEGEYAAAEAEIARYAAAFQDEFEPVRMRAALELKRSTPAAALAIYDRAFRPLWPEEMRASYFKLLTDEGVLREFEGRARTALAANPADLDATARLFHYFRSQNNPAAARRALLQYRTAKESGRQPWTAAELETAAQLFAMLPDVNESARLYYALYSAPPQNGPQQERALAGLAALLLNSAGEPIQFGSGDLSFYKDIATIDASPGFLNGILSLVLNGSGPRWEYQAQNAKSAAYFHRAAGARLLALLDQRFPNSPRRDGLHAAMVGAYGAYGDDASVIRAGREYLAAFPASTARTRVATLVADALARAGRVDEEFALYDQLLRELAAKSSGVPVGSAGDRAGQTGARSPEYAQILDRYLSRLSELRRPMDALRVYRGEIDRNPNDPGLYERLAAFVEQNGMSRDVEDVYAKAIAKFADRSWYDKLARWYLRNKQSRELERVTRQVIAIFSGAEVERYFGEIVSATHPDAVLYRQLNVYAHERFPNDLVFVRNLLDAYGRQETRDSAAADRLLRQYWFYDARLRTRFFEHLSQQGTLATELAEIRAQNASVAQNPAAVQFTAEAEAWLCQFEAAAPAARALAMAYPGRHEFTDKAVSLYRSLAAYDPRNTETALLLAANDRKARPRDRQVLARMGDILADRELFTRARTYWDQIPLTQPAEPSAYLDAATIYWDYYRFDDSLRWIQAARRKFDDSALFAYEAGAIYEGKRDYASAIRQYAAGAIDGQDAAGRRLLRLATRAQTRDAVDRATAAAVASDASPGAVALRIEVLEALQRRSELETLLRARVEVEKDAAALTTLSETARRLGFDRIQERAAERLVSLSNDPVDRMRLTLARVRLLESTKNVAAATTVVDALYRQNPLILGVVRGAVDFHVRNGQHPAAMDTLLDAAKHARADLAAQFTLEAARVATSAGQFDRARGLLTGLLAADPMRAEYLTAMGDTYLQAKDDRGFRDYQLAAIAQIKRSPLAPADRLERIATLRRSLIPALDRMHETAAAVDQYIELVNSYPEDDALTREAARYAAAHGEQGRVIAFYRKTIGEAPRDYRWPIVLARMETVAENYPAAINDYELALRNRPDRADVIEAKARLEERLLRFADALKSYGRLYELTYRDPQWMVKAAEMHARSGRVQETVAALKTAIIGARTETAAADFEIAEHLESWHMLAEAVPFAERGALDPENLLKSYANLQVYTRIMTEARRMDSLLSIEGAQLGTYQTIGNIAAPIVTTTYTPEDKVRLEQLLSARGGDLLTLAGTFGLVELEARWRRDAMFAQNEQVDPQLSALENRRGAFGEWGRELTSYAAMHPGRPASSGALAQAAIAFRAEGDVTSEMAAMNEAMKRNGLSGALLERYLELLATRSPGELLALIRGNGSDDIRNRAVHAAIASGQRDLAYEAVRVRGSSLPPVWTNAFTALTGVYFSDSSPAIGNAFQSALDTRTIGDRLRAPRKPDSVIAGSVWFYYGARYGEHLTGATAEDWLPASLEAAPEDAGAYVALGDWYAAHREPGKALARYDQALELDHDRSDAHDHAARALWESGRKPEAIARWKSAIAAFVSIQSRGIRVPEPFWPRAAQTFAAIGERRALPELRAEIAHLLSDYENRNGAYRFRELLAPAAEASVQSGEGLQWLLPVAQSASEPDSVMQILMQTPGLTLPQQIALEREQIAILEKPAESSAGDARDYASGRVDGARLRLIELLLDAGDVTAASAEWRRIPQETEHRRRFDGRDFRDLTEIRLAAKTNGLAELLERWRAKPEFAPPAESLRNAAASLRGSGEEAAARTVLGFLYDRELRDGNLDAATFLGLAEVKLEENDNAAALALLNRVALIREDGFDTLVRSAELLHKHGKTAEAVDFLRRRIQAAPWDSEAKSQLATLLPAGAERDRLFADVIADPLAGYGVRAAAARLASGEARRAAPAGTELAALGSADGTFKPYWVESRLVAISAAGDTERRLRLAREALADAPGDPRARTAAVKAALAARRDSLALALATDKFEGATELNEALAAAAMRVDDLATAERYLREILKARPDVKTRIDALTAEQRRRAQNASRQPAIKNVIEQDHPVRPRIVGSAQ